MKKNREIICGLTAWVLTVCFFLSCLLIPGLSERISEHGNINILVYGMTLVLFCILFLAGMAWSTSRQNNSLKLTESPVAKKTALVILLGSQLPFWIVCVTRETEQVGTVSMKYGWHTQPLAVMILLFLAELAVFFWLYENLSLTEKKGEWIIWLTYAALVVLIFYCMYTPNIYGRGEQGDNYHAHAYFNSVYNVYQGVPYTHNVTSIYGHYGLFFKIPMKLVHGDFRGLCADDGRAWGTDLYRGISGTADACKKQNSQSDCSICTCVPCAWHARWILLAGAAAQSAFSCASASLWNGDP